MDGRPAYLVNNWSVFDSPKLAAVYPLRPPYAQELIERLADMVVEPRRVLDLGCGTGEIARRLIAYVAEIDAVDPSAPMIDLARSLEGGDNPDIHWHCIRAENFPFDRGYGLVLAAGSLHWMHLDVVLPRIGDVLGAQGLFAVVLGGGSRAVNVPWAAELNALVPKYSVMQDWAPYDVVKEISKRGLFEVTELFSTRPFRFRQSIKNYVAQFHSQAGFAEDRMGAKAARDFDDAIRHLVRPFAKLDGMLELELVVDVAFGRAKRSSPRSNNEARQGDNESGGGGLFIHSGDHRESPVGFGRPTCNTNLGPSDDR
jgi:SAM-dependent methyltransferase